MIVINIQTSNLKERNLIHATQVNVRCNYATWSQHAIFWYQKVLALVLPFGWNNTLACTGMIKAVWNIWNGVIPTTSSETHTYTLTDSKIATVNSFECIHRGTQSYTVAIREQNIIYRNVASVVFSINTFKNHLIVASAGNCYFCFFPYIAL